MFAECQNTSTRQRGHLPSADGATLSKHTAHDMPEVCRVPAVGKALALSISYLCRVPLGLHTAKAARVPAVRRPLGWLTEFILCRVPSADTRQMFFRRVPENRHSANMVNFFRPSNFFVLYLNLRI